MKSLVSVGRVLPFRPAGPKSRTRPTLRTGGAGTLQTITSERGTSSFPAHSRSCRGGWRRRTTWRTGSRRVVVLAIGWEGLFLEGEAGSADPLAAALAAALDADLIRLQCYEGLDITQPSTSGTSAQLLELRFLAAAGAVNREDARRELYSDAFSSSARS